VASRKGGGRGAFVSHLLLEWEKWGQKGKETPIRALDAVFREGGFWILAGVGRFHDPRRGEKKRERKNLGVKMVVTWEARDRLGGACLHPKHNRLELEGESKDQ